MSSEHCSLCQLPIKISLTSGARNKAIYDCGHVFHLSCVLTRATYNVTTCPKCSITKETFADLGDDRNIAISASIQSRIQRRKFKPKENEGFIHKISKIIKPFTPEPTDFKDYINMNYSLSTIRKLGFTPEDAVQENIKWGLLSKQYNSEHLLGFGFKWEHMLAMGIQINHFRNFSWTQIRHTLNVDANDMLKLNMNIVDLADLKYTPHQLTDLGFTWPIMTSLGANVHTLRFFNFKLDEIKTYWNPNVNQWIEAGFYDQKHVEEAGWNIETVKKVLPTSSYRTSGRMIRLNF